MLKSGTTFVTPTVDGTAVGEAVEGCGHRVDAVYGRLDADEDCAIGSNLDEVR